MTTDFLVIGCGIAGLSFAIRAARHGSVTVLAKRDCLESNTAWAQGGIASVLPPGFCADGDTLEMHIADTLDAEVVGLSVPFPGNLVAALRIGRRLRARNIRRAAPRL